jgi:hypothetical protein
MIVRIFSEGQYRVPDAASARLHELDQEYVSAVESGDEEAFAASFAALLAYVRSSGERLADDELEPSELMLPPADISFEEARSEFTGEGLIPD